MSLKDIIDQSEGRIELIDATPRSLNPSIDSTFTKIFHPGMVDVGYADGRKVAIFIKVVYDDEGELHITGVEGPRVTGNCAGSAGQIDMNYTPEFIDEKVRLDKTWTRDQLNELLRIWDRWHLNYMKSGTPTQEAYLRLHRVNVTYPKSQYDQDLDTLKTAGLNPDPDTGYEYGTAWLREEVPTEVLDWLRALPETIKTPAWI